MAKDLLKVISADNVVSDLNLMSPNFSHAVYKDMANVFIFINKISEADIKILRDMVKDVVDSKKELSALTSEIDTLKAKVETTTGDNKKKLSDDLAKLVKYQNELTVYVDGITGSVINVDDKKTGVFCRVTWKIFHAIVTMWDMDNKPLPFTTPEKQTNQEKINILSTSGVIKPTRK
jgi:hypothetical protein